MKLSGKWRGFLGHLGPYIIVIGMLGVINLLTSPDYPWVIWPALGWGVGLAFHLMGIVLSEMKQVSKKWRGFAGHFGSYAIIMGLLLAIYLMTDPGGYPWFIWPALGWGTAVALHFFSTVMASGHSREDDDDAEQTAVAEKQPAQQVIKSTQNSRQPAPGQVANATIQAHLERAKTYRRQIKGFIGATTDARARERLQDLAKQVGAWTEAIEALAQRIDRFERDTVIQQDLESVPQSIAKLEAQLAEETDESTRAELERTLANRQKQRSALEHLQSTMRRAEIKIESTLSSLGTIYSQLLTSQSTDHVADYSRLSADVDEEVRTLQDQLEALEEVKLGGQW